ncbi:hypothetical protein DXG01_011242 [Tephrocybe rancida]|nr:hypothetical protein DXG01_011242 [Tephrocybe rancida]
MAYRRLVRFLKAFNTTGKLWKEVVFLQAILLGFKAMLCIPTKPKASRATRGSSSAPSTAFKSSDIVDTWSLDPAFFQALSEWTRDNPETPLGRILSKVKSRLENGVGDYIDLIPDSPFPARSLFKGLAALVHVGAMLSQSGRMVQEFAQEIVEWVVHVKEAFMEAGNGGLTRTTWKNLAKIREIIDNITTWAEFQLTQPTFSLARIDASAEIEEFKKQLEVARRNFQNRWMICISGGLDAMLQRFLKITRNLEVVTISMEDIRFRLEKMSRERDSDMGLNKRNTFLKEKLIYVAGAAYEKQDNAPCTPGTRIAVLKDIMRWRDDLSETSESNFLWLTGDPGCGKTSIVVSFAKDCKDAKVLWAQFFVDASNDETMHPKNIFPDLARQLWLHDSSSTGAVGQYLYDTLHGQPTLLDSISDLQAQKIFIDAIKVASKVAGDKPVVVIFDALDGTRRKDLEATARVFSALFQKLSGYPNVKILISSRIEDDIHKVFAPGTHVKRIDLPLTDPTCLNDVTIYLNAHDRAFPIPPDILPSVIDLVSGHFIYAATILALWTQFCEDYGAGAAIQLRDVVTNAGQREPGDKTKRPIDSLYSAILKGRYAETGDKWLYEIFRRLVGAIVVSKEPLTLDQLENLLDLKKDSNHSSTLVDVKNFVRRLRTVLVAGTGNIDGTTVLRVHNSFRDFIVSLEAESEFRVDKETANAELGIRCFHHIGEAYSDVRAHGSGELSHALRYALRYCALHVPNEGGTALGVVIADPAQNPLQLHDLIQRSSNDSHTGPLSICLPNDEPYISTNVDKHSLRWNPVDGKLVDGAILMRESMSHHSSDIMSLDISQHGYHVISGCLDSSIHVWDSHSLQRVGSPSNSGVMAMAFSSDHTKAVSASEDHTLHMWDAYTGDPIGQPFRGHTAEINSIAFLPDGLFLVSGSDDCTIRVWETQTGNPIDRPPMQHDGHIYSVTVSDDGSKILSCSADKTIRLWDFDTGFQIGQPFIGHTDVVFSASISQDSNYLASGSKDMTVRLWSVERNEEFDPWTGHTNYVTSVVFSPRGSHVLSSSLDRTVRLWDRDGQIKHIFKGSEEGGRYPITFSPDGQILFGAGRSLSISNLSRKRLASGEVPTIEWTSLSPNGSLMVSAASDHQLYLWRLDSGHTPGQGHAAGVPLETRDTPIRYVAFSSDESHIAGLSESGALHVWDVATPRLAGFLPLNPINTATSVSFTDGHEIILSDEGKKTRAIFTFENEKLVMRDDSTDSCEPHPISFFDLTRDPHTYPGLEEHPNRLLKEVRWFPSKSNTVFWAYINQRLIRGGSDGTFVVLPL